MSGWTFITRANCPTCHGAGTAIESETLPNGDLRIKARWCECATMDFRSDPAPSPPRPPLRPDGTPLPEPPYK